MIRASLFLFLLLLLHEKPKSRFRQLSKDDEINEINCIQRNSHGKHEAYGVIS